MSALCFKARVDPLHMWFVICRILRLVGQEPMIECAAAERDNRLSDACFPSFLLEGDIASLKLPKNIGKSEFYSLFFFYIRYLEIVHPIWHKTHFKKKMVVQLFCYNLALWNYVVCSILDANWKGKLTNSTLHLLYEN